MSFYPKLRHLEAYPFEQEGEQFYYLRDPGEVAENSLIFSSPEFFILTLLDGRHSVADIKQRFSSEFNGYALSDDQLQVFLDHLEENFYLESANYQNRVKNIVEEFRGAGVRPAWHAGICYEKDPEALRRQIEGFYTHPDGAGLAAQRRTRNGMNLRAIMVPHIDLRVGAPSYTHAYRDLAVSSDADLFIILGIAHNGGSDFFIATEKDFQTPLGRVQTDIGFLREWSKNAGRDFTREEIYHRSEHSIEFQLPFLQHRIDRPFKILPVLCGSLFPYIQNPTAEIPEIASQVKALRKTIRESNRKVTFILSVDLAHMGPKFGDNFRITPERAAEIRAADYKMFEVLENLDREAFYQLSKKDLMARNVDACPATLALLNLMPEGAAELVAYDQNLQEDSGSVVTYGSMLIYGPEI